MITTQHKDMYLIAEIYSELINDMQAQIFEYESKRPECMNEELNLENWDNKISYYEELFIKQKISLLQSTLKKGVNFIERI